MTSDATSVPTVTMAASAASSIAPASLGEGHARRFTSLAPTLERSRNKTAEEATISGRLEAAKADGDLDAERRACLDLARHLEGRGIGLGSAAELYRRAGEIAADPDIFRKLAALEEKLGRPGRAAAALARALELDAQLGGRVRLGWLLMRAEDYAGAVKAFGRAWTDTGEALARELHGALAFAGAKAVSHEEGAAFYLDASAARAAADQGDAEVDDIARAFALSPTGPVAERMAQALERRNTAALADAFLEGFALSLTNSARGEAIGSLREARLRRGDVGGALVLALSDLPAMRETDAFDELLLRAGLPEVLAEHLGMRASASAPAERVRILTERMRLLSGSLSDAEGALRVAAEVLALAPEEPEALARLSAYAEEGVSSAGAIAVLVERIARGDGALGALAEAVARLGERTDRPSLVVVALRASLRSSDDPSIRARLAAAEARCEERLAASGGDASRDWKRARTTVLGTMTERREELWTDLAELEGHEVHALEAWSLAAERAMCVGDTTRAVSLARRAVSHATTGRDSDAARMLLARAELAGGAKSAALTSLVVDGTVRRAHAPLALLIALDVGDALGVARSCETLLDASSGRARAALRRVACRAFLAASDFVSARRLASDAWDAEPSDPCTAAIVSEVHLHERMEPASAAMALASVDAIGALLWPDAKRVELLAQLAADAGDLQASLSHGQRWIGLRPADPAPLATFLDRLYTSTDTARIADSLGWILSLPYPATLLAEHVVKGLAALRRDPERRMMAARRAFDVLGPSNDALRSMLIEIARMSKDFAFAATVLERALSCGDARGGPAARGEGYATLADLYSLALDADGEVRALVSALRDGAVIEDLDDRLARFSAASLGGDAEVAWLDVLAERAPLKGEAHAALALRRLGAALWDLAGDRSGAVAVWVDATRHAAFRGHTTLRRDLVAFAGHEEALECLVALADHEPDAARSGSLLAEAARVATALGDDSRTFDLARRALQKNPAHTDALTSAEAGARGEGADVPLSTLYSEVASKALGRFGRRAAHYRAARFFESRGAFTLAVEHATAAFLAVPSEGSALQLLARAGTRAGDSSAVFDAVDRLAGSTKSVSQRAAWLVRASEVGDLESGLAERTDALLRALILVPDPLTLGKLAGAIRRQVVAYPSDADALVLRFVRAARAVLPKCEGPDGARVAVRIAELAASFARDLVLAWDAIDRAFQCDGDIDEYKELVTLVPSLVEAESGRAAFARAIAVSEKPYSSLGAAAFALLAALASKFGEGSLARRLVIASVTRDADDDHIVTSADEALLSFPDDADRKKFDRAVSSERLLEALLRAAGSDRASSDSVSELRHLARARGVAAAAMPEEALARLVELERDAPQSHRTEAHVDNVEALLRRASAAEAAGEHEVHERTLEEIASSMNASLEVRVDALLRLARAFDAVEPVRAESYYRRVAALEPTNEESDSAIEEILTRQGNYAALAAHLGARAEKLSRDPSKTESLRALRLRRAALLEQRLGRPDEARAELEALLEVHPKNESALRYLADLAERGGDLIATVDLLERLRSLDSTDVDARNEAEVRIARIRFDGGRIEEARALVAGVLARGENLDAIRLRVDIARHHREPRELGDALASFARAGAEDAEVRSEILVEAAQAAARAGDVEVSLRRAQEAARVAPQVASVQLFARGLEYRTRGAGSVEEAQSTIQSLSQVRAHLMPADVALRAFLMAEAARAISGGGAGLELLLETRAELGPHALLALGMAERLAAQGRHEDALVAFDEAIAGPLLGMRRAAEVQLSASVSAEKIGDLSLALRYAEAVLREPDLRLAGLERVRRLAFAFGDVRKQRSALRQLVAMQQGDLRIEAMKDLAGTLLSSEVVTDRDEGRSLLEAALRETPRGRALGEEIRAWLERLDREVARPDEVVPALPEAPIEPPAPPAVVDLSAGDVSSPEVERRTVLQTLDKTLASSGQPTANDGPRLTQPHGLFVELATVEGVPDGAPSAREVLSSDDIVAVLNAREVPKAPPLPSATNHSLLDGSDPFPEHAFTTKDPFPAAPGPSASVHAPSQSEPFDETVRAPQAHETAPASIASQLLTLPSLSPQVLSAVARGALPDSDCATRFAEARALVAAGRWFEAEPLLAHAIAGGSLEAADLLADVLEGQLSRAPVHLRARRLAAELAPGDQLRLAALRRAAAADNNQTYGRALEHVARCLEGVDAEPPPLQHQTEQPGILSLLTRIGREGVGEAFALVWEHASQTFVRNAASSMSGLERVSPGEDSPAGRILEASARLLGLTSARLSIRRIVGAQSLTAHVALALPPCGVLHGRGDETGPELAFVVGRALGASLAPHALLLGQSEADARGLFRAMLGAFGPPEAARELDRATATLGEILWQTLPTKAQRRLSDLLAHETSASFDDALARAQQASLRVGLFVSGSFREATRAVLLDAGREPSAAGAADLVELIRTIPALSDLYRLAIRPEYADARFSSSGRTGRPGAKLG